MPDFIIVLTNAFNSPMLEALRANSAASCSTCSFVLESMGRGSCRRRCLGQLTVIAGKHKIPDRPTPDSNHDQPIAPNRLNQDFSTEDINQVWLTDITYIPTKEGFTYLCAFVDLHSRKIIGWKTSRKIDSELVIESLDQAIVFRSPSAGLIVHSDRGSRYASAAFRRRLVERELVQSMSRRGNCYDNAPMEFFFKSCKTEEVQEVYGTHEHATRGVSDYIEQFYNPRRMHSSLDYRSPIDFEHAIARTSLVGET
ncbi:IS3 family transposase [Stieleria magnilauensis]|uniref:IS3 family transposase n=1 Tax=Stieleria magnilauensis TaxID=2527963 RepID=UPI003AF6B19E